MNKKTLIVLTVIFAIIAVGVILTKQPSETIKESPAEEQEEKTDLFSSQIVWWDNQALAELHECMGAELECVKQIMEKYEAGSEAIGFYQKTGWFATEFQEYGKVDLVLILNPWRANSNDDYALVNGEPSVVIVEDEISIDNKNIGNYELLSQINPEYSIWGTDCGFSEKDGNSFVFNADIKDERGCHACSSGYVAVISFDFDQDGVYQGLRLKEINKTNQE